MYFVEEYTLKDITLNDKILVQNMSKNGPSLETINRTIMEMINQKCTGTLTVIINFNDGGIRGLKIIHERVVK